jgi:Leucine-rich repeat (LRR) protein
MTMLIRVLFLGAIALLFACGSYDVELNDNIVYSPTKLYQASSIEDPALLGCVNAAIQEQGVNHAKALTTLLCPSGDIRSLAGLEQFKNLQQLGLSQNKIQSIAPLTQLRKLSQLDLRENSVSSVTALQSLPLLKLIKLQGNVDLDCDSLGALALEQVELPAHCGP